MIKNLRNILSSIFVGFSNFRKFNNEILIETYSYMILNNHKVYMNNEDLETFRNWVDSKRGNNFDSQLLQVLFFSEENQEKDILRLNEDGTAYFSSSSKFEKMNLLNNLDIVEKDIEIQALMGRFKYVETKLDNR